MNDEPKWDLIFSYTRAQAIEDGVLVDVTETAKEAGFRIPVALTQSVWAEYVAVPEGVEGQDEEGPPLGCLVDVPLRHCLPGTPRAGGPLLGSREERQPRRGAAACDAQGRLRPR